MAETTHRGSWKLHLTEFVINSSGHQHGHPSDILCEIQVIAFIEM
jgi:hypothetical protein